MPTHCCYIDALASSSLYQSRLWTSHTLNAWDRNFQVTMSLPHHVHILGISHPRPVSSAHHQSSLQIRSFQATCLVLLILLTRKTGWCGGWGKVQNAESMWSHGRNRCLAPHADDFFISCGHIDFVALRTIMERWYCAVEYCECIYDC